MRAYLAMAAAVLVAVAGLRVGVVPAERCMPVGAPAAEAAAARAVAWFDANQRADGSFTYLARDDGTDLGGYSEVRHAGVLLALEQAARQEVPGAREVADRAWTWAEARLVPAGDGVGGVALARTPGATSGRVASGASALLALASLERGDEAAGDLDRAASLGRFLAAVVDGEGAVAAQYDLGRGGPVADRHDPFFTGEVLWALVRLDAARPDPTVAGAAARVAAYLPGRDDAERRFPPVSDHWAAYAYAELVRRGEALSPAQAAHARLVAELVGVQVRMEATRFAGGVEQLLRRGPAVGSGVGTLGEAGANLLLLPDPPPGLEERVRCVAGMLVARQAADGAWFTAGVTRMDDQQHALSALLLARPWLDAEAPAVGGGESPPPWWWLAGAAAAAAAVSWSAAASDVRKVAHPSRRRPVVGAQDHPPSVEPPPAWFHARSAVGRQVAAVGGGLSVLLGVVVAAASGPALDALAVSPASARLGAGTGALLVAVAALARPSGLGHVGAGAGLALAASAALGLSVGADGGWSAVAAVSAAGALGAVAGAWRPHRRWLEVGRVGGAAALLLAVELLARGVLAV